MHYNLTYGQQDVIVSDTTGEVLTSTLVDLLRLFPDKYKESEILKDYILAIKMIMGVWIDQTRDIPELADPYDCPSTYLNRLARMINLDLAFGDNVTVKDQRNQITEATEWYKLKGTYHAMQLIAASTGMTIEIHDMWTTNYSTFVKVDWWVGNEGEYPPGLSLAYYKTPHFTVDAILDKVYGGTGSGDPARLCDADILETLYNAIEKVRPVNTVPHYEITLSPVTYEDKAVYTTAVQVKATITDSWIYSWLHFDATPAVKSDDGEVFDDSDTSFFADITKWKIGNGNEGVTPDHSWTSLASAVASGSGNTYVVYADRVVVTATIPSGTALTDVTECGLFLNDGTTMAAVATFPRISKPIGLELKVVFTIYR
jgi:phage tail P2-like protein